jgi:hypothetical protein
VVTFEVSISEIVGMEYSNMLIENSSRFVFEARTIIKKSFANVDNFFNYYNLNSTTDLEGEQQFYSPLLDKIGQKIKVQKAHFPFNRPSGATRLTKMGCGDQAASTGVCEGQKKGLSPSESDSDSNDEEHEIEFFEESRS